MSFFRNFQARARNQRLIRAAIAYGALAWLLAQVGALLAAAFDWPGWLLQGLIFLLVVGFPVIIAIAWFVGTGDGAGTGDMPGEAAPGQTRYARSDGTAIAYQVTGSGPVDIVLVHGWISNVELAWENPSLRIFLQRLASMGRLITFDKRGTGLSDRGGPPPTFEQRMDDLLAVMDAAGSDRAVLIGYSEGGPMCALFAATYPDRTQGLILYGTYVKRVKTEDYPWAPTREERINAIELVGKTWGESFDLDLYAPSMAGDSEFAQWQASYWRRSASPRDAVEMLRLNTDIDVRSVLPAIHVPTLVLHRTGDRDANSAEGRYIAEHIPSANFLELPGVDHLPYVGRIEDILQPIGEFIGNLGGVAEFDSVLVTVMAISYDLRSAAADAFRAFIESRVGRYRGELQSIDPQYLTATFDGSGRAIQCAIEIREHALHQDLDCRIVLHIGECKRFGGQLSGEPLALVNSLVGEAQTGEIIATRTIWDLVADHEFKRRGSVMVPGGEIDLFALESAEV